MQAFESALSEHFAGLRDYARASGREAIDKLIVPLTALLPNPAGAAAAELVRELRAESARAPAPLRNVWTGLADALGAQQRRARSIASSGAAWAS